MARRLPMKSRPHENGYALLMVLIAVGLVAIMLGLLESRAREEAETAIGLRDQAQAQAAVDGAIWQAVWQALPGHAPGWPADKSTHEITEGDAKVLVSVEDLAGRLDLNRDSAAAVAVILRSFGVDAGTALGLGQKLTDWRNDDTVKQTFGAKLPQYQAAGLPYGPPGTDYENPAEIEFVLGMTPEIAKALAPRVTIYSSGLPQLSAARDATEYAALSTALQSEPAPSREPSAVFFYSFVAHTHVGSATATRNAVLRLDMDASNQGKFWRVLEWD